MILFCTASCVTLCRGPMIDLTPPHTLTGGALELRINKRPSTVMTQDADGSMREVSSQYASGMVTSWNKFCFTGLRSFCEGLCVLKE